MRAVVNFVAVQSNREPLKTNTLISHLQSVLNQTVGNNNFQQVSKSARNGLKSHCAEQRLLQHSTISNKLPQETQAQNRRMLSRVLAALGVYFRKV
jgi:hypothetical protein